MMQAPGGENRVLFHCYLKCDISEKKFVIKCIRLPKTNFYDMLDIISDKRLER